MQVAPLRAGHLIVSTVVALSLVVVGTTARARTLYCPGDCNDDRVVTVDELITVVNVALGESTVAACTAADSNADAQVTVDEVVGAVNTALAGCPLLEGNACNGSEVLCDRRFDEVAYATTHNAMSNADEGFAGPNQNHPIPCQLEDGVRALMLDTYLYENEVYLCHVECSLLGGKPLLEGLMEIRAFLERHPREVVSIIFEAYVSAQDTAEVFEDAGLMPYVHAQELGTPWPTLGEMIEEGRRLVVFSDRDRGVLPWYLYIWDFAWETHFEAEAPEDFSCAPNRGNTANPLFILNHFLTRTFGSPRLAQLVNFNPFFIDRARECLQESGHTPNFVAVDFYDIGDVIEVVNELNEERAESVSP